MVSVIRTTKTDYKNKGIYAANGRFMTEEGVIIDVADELERIFGAMPFDLSATMSVKEDLSGQDSVEPEGE